MVFTSWLWLSGFVLLSVFGFNNAYAQEVIIINATEPCFLNSTATYHILENCRANDDYLKWIMAPWTWISGGFFTGLLFAVIILGSYLKFKKAIYPIVVGIVSMPFAVTLFPESFVSFAIIMAFTAIALLIAFIYVRQTRQ